MKRRLFILFMPLALAACFLIFGVDALAEEPQWILKSPMPTARSAPAVGIIDGKIYIAGGDNSNDQASDNLEVYNPADDTWEIKPPMAVPRWGLTSGIIDGKYYIIAGGSPVPFGTVITEEFDPATNQWLTKSDMPNPGWGVASGVINNKLYVVGGYNWPNWGMNSNREYDPVTNQWTLKAPMPTSRSWLGAEVIDNKLYAVGGWNQNDTVDLPTLEVYDPASDSWTVRASLPVGLRNVATAVLEGKFYVMGGYTGEGASEKFYSSVYVYDPATNVWMRLADLPQAIAGGAGKTVDGNIYLFGGQTGTTILNTTYVWQQKKQIDPVILVPGIMGSWEVDGEWKLDPILHTYDNLWEALKLAGYEEGKNLFAFPYEWRQDNILSAYQLKQKIDEVKSICQCNKVDIIAHSMGGLVARYYAESDDYANDIDQLVFLGTPHKGSPKSYLTWEGGEFSDEKLELFDLLQKFIFTFEAHSRGYNSLFNYIQDYAKSVEQLLPDYAYLQDVGQTSFRIYDSLNYPNNYPYNTFLESLNLPNEIDRLTDSGIKIKNFIGNTGDETIGAISVSLGEQYWPMWENGYAEEVVRLSGDGTVPEISSSMFTPIKIDNTNHLSLPTKAQKQIIQYISGSLPAAEVNDFKIPNALLVFRIFSPADFVIIAPDGEKLGKDFVSNLSINEIEGAFYNGFDADMEFAIIPDPMDGEYRIELQGTSNGEYKLSASIINENNETEKDFSGNIEVNQKQDFTINYNQQAEDPVGELEPEDTVAPIITINSPQLNQQYLRNQNLVIDYLITDDFSGVSTTTIIIDNQEISATTIDLFDYAIGTHTLTITSVDKKGNIGRAQVSFEVIANIDSTIVDIEEIYNRGWLTGRITKAIIVNAFRLIDIEVKYFNKQIKDQQKLIEKMKNDPDLTPERKQKLIEQYNKKLAIIEKNKQKAINNGLDVILKLVNVAKKQNVINQTGYDIIINDINYLKENL